MEITEFPRPTGRGLRKLTTGHLVATRLADQAPALPAGLRHPNQLLATLRRAAPYLGQTRLLPLMEALFRWTQPQDWAADAEPVVWPSNDELALALDCSERHVSRLIASAIEARLIAPRDGADRKRRGCRREGRILWAWGLSLRPMAARHAEFLQAAEEGEARRRQCRLLRQQAGAARQFLTQLATLAEARGAVLPALEQHRLEAPHLAATLRRQEDPARLAAVVELLQERAEAARAALEALAAGPVENADMSGSADAGVSANIPTNQTPELRKYAVAAQEAAPVEAVRPEDMAAGSVSAAELLHLAPRLAGCLGGARADWAGISGAAAVLAGQLGIPRALYGEACLALGRRPAAVAVAVISTRAEGHFHTAGPGGYLRGMLQRAAKGELRLDRSIHGLRDAAGYGPRRRLTAVNRGFDGMRPGGMRYPGPNALANASASEAHG